MATIKPRINITAEPEVEQALRLAAKRDGVPVATKAAELLSIALELEEDIALSKIADERKKIPGKFMSHDDFWSKVKAHGSD